MKSKLWREYATTVLGWSDPMDDRIANCQHAFKAGYDAGVENILQQTYSEVESKFRAFLEGLEMENIDELMQKTPVELKLVGAVMASRMKDLKIVALKQEIKDRGRRC